MDLMVKEKNLRVRLPIQGMTCTGCEDHIVEVLENAGTKEVAASFQRGEAIFQVARDADLEAAKRAVAQTGYQPGREEILTLEGVSTSSIEESGDYDLLIIGSGGAAFSAAIQAVGQGAKVGMVERGTVGGTCVNIGCVPSKTLLRAGETQHLARQHPFAGLQTSAGPVDLKALVEQKDELVNQLRQQKYIDLIDEYGFELIHGEARFVDHRTVDVDGRKITARRFLIATGASPAVPEIPGLNEIDFLTSTSALELKEVPKRLAVIGAGYIALELGQYFHHLGAEVTLMQRSPRLLKTYEPEVSEAVTQVLTEQGIRLVTGASFECVEQNGGITTIHLTIDGEKRVIEADAVLVATGRRPNTPALQLDAAGVQVGSRGEVVVDEYQQTSNPRIYAAGDVTLGPQFVYVAAHQGGIAAENALGTAKRKIDLRAVPGVTFTHPSIATVGLTEVEAKDQGHLVQSSVLPLEAVPRALVNRETTGVFKLVVDKQTQKVLGVHIVAENAGDVIFAATLAVKYGLTVEDLRETLAPYLTMAEGLKLAALTFDKDVSKLSCCAG
ncbi:mercuric reductase [Kroppenstedtia guangzhouensis]|uniref:Mercuric reductase n=2 Tax=Kroppenstedtia guangzhouensis TaxID=1274356 RepID=A0ABQ1H676_9BACL|nr:mercuric reductase [Kroppenstedtia guangzhouensis]